MTDQERDEHWLRASFEVAHRARARGNHPFGAVLVDANGNLLLEGENTVNTDNDLTGHAETNLARDAARQFSPDVLAGATMYASTEPCPMCAGATFWSGIGRIVFGLRAARLYVMTGGSENDRSFLLTCADVLAKGTPRTEVIGPVLEDEAAEVHSGFWQA